MRHYNAYTPFDVIIKNVEKGKHELLVMVDNSFSSDSALHIPNDYFTYGGIIRPVVMEEVNDVFIERLEFSPALIDDNKFEAAETKLLNAVEVMPDSRIYFELAKVQRILNKFLRAEDNFKIATELNPKDIRVWFEWINMEDNRGRYNITLQLTEKALEKTNNDVSILIQRINILKFRRDFAQLRKEVKQYVEIYEKEQRQ